MAVVEGKKTDEDGKRKKIEEVKKWKTEEDAEKENENERTAKLQSKLVSQAPANLLTAAGETFASVSNEQGPRPVDSAKGIHIQNDGDVHNIPSPMLCDQYGMAGLLAYLRSADSPPIVSLALGYDLTTLGLNLNITEYAYSWKRTLHTSFGGPWAEHGVRAHEMDVVTPEEYLTNTHIRDKLPPVKLNKLSEDVLFFLFYNCTGEVYQLAAACELFQRDWRYHKGEGVWLIRSPFGQLKEQTGTFERGNYNVFDPVQWRKIPKELKLEYKELEDRPRLPTTMPSVNTSILGQNVIAGQGAPNGPNVAAEGKTDTGTGTAKADTVIAAIPANGKVSVN
ncbi:hypothetical protein WR25_03882 [Diploscapter pachys]|uniref:NOT2/NOT3/NOT5 C-terminal domain-containing protein n=1 Tax=Diploscapter pachys TaxID=2018661 RepID=A0A2A2JMS3_9BILA|nr:hypothetical protein WR25_03882 [Diploscapter pachys]